MVEFTETPLGKNEVQLNSQMRLSFDRYNKTLLYKYRKRASKGRGAEFSNEFGYGNEKHYTSFEYLGRQLMQGEFDEYLMEQISKSEEKDIERLIEAINNTYKHLDKVANEIAENLKEKIIINIESKKKKQVVKGMVVGDDDGDDD